ncbi:MAG TPA: hypothetical protein VJ806_12050 [Luteimonas sp.]|nr:hypothetical protein [Luteimonas sp.]
MTFTEIFPVGAIVSLISAALLRNSRLWPARLIGSRCVFVESSLLDCFSFQLLRYLGAKAVEQARLYGIADIGF